MLIMELIVVSAACRGRRLHDQILCARARALALGLLAVVALAACDTSGEPSGQPTAPTAPATASTGAAVPTPPSRTGASVSASPTPPVPPPASPLPGATLTGTVFRSDVEGGCLGLTGDDGKNYELLVAGDRSAVTEGARVRVTGRVRTDVATICQIGTPFEVTSVERL